MGLPVIQQPLFDLYIPSLDKEVKCRPFVVREEKILLMAQAGRDPKEIVKAIQQVVNNCIQDKELDISNLTTFDLEYIFIKLRSKSVNNIAEIAYRDNEDEKTYDFEIDLDKVELYRDPEHSTTIKVDSNTTLKMRYPKIEMMEKMVQLQTEVDVFFEVVRYCIDSVIQGDELYKMSEFNQEEQDQFVAGLDVKTFNKITKFFSTIPKLSYTIEYTNEKGTERKITLESLTDFFTLG